MHLEVAVDPAFRGRVTELAIAFEDGKGQPLLNGGALSFYVTAGPKGYQAAVPIDELRALGLDAKSKARLAWVRVKGVTWPCDALATHCVLWPTWMGAVRK
jgi:hypothetical protein